MTSDFINNLKNRNHACNVRQNVHGPNIDKTAFCPQENEIDSDCYCLYERKTVMELSEMMILPDQTDEPMDRGTIIKY